MTGESEIPKYCTNVMKGWRRLPIGETVTAELKLERDLMCNSRQVCARTKE